MLILRPYEPRRLMPVPRRQWMPASEARPKNCFGHEDRTCFRATARTHDGVICWRGWFEDRDDFDAFIWAIARAEILGEAIPAPIRQLPSPWWDDRFAGLVYDFATTIFHVSPTGSNQTGTSPADWGNSQNAVETLGAGGSGGASMGTNAAGCGGGGGAWNGRGHYESLGANHNFAVPGTTTYTWQVGAGGTAVSRASNGNTTGNAGGDTWFNGTTLAGSSVGSKGGSGGGATGTSANGGAGGVGASGQGTSSFDGGRGGNLTGGSGRRAAGGGGAAGKNGAGNQGVDSSSTTNGTITNGGSGDAGFGGAAGSSGNGGAGQEWDVTHGSGGGGSGRNGTTTGRQGGLYGGAGGGNADNAACDSGAGRDGIIVLTYTPGGGGSIAGRSRLTESGTLGGLAAKEGRAPA